MSACRQKKKEEKSIKIKSQTRERSHALTLATSSVCSMFLNSLKAFLLILCYFWESKLVSGYWHGMLTWFAWWQLDLLHVKGPLAYTKWSPLRRVWQTITYYLDATVVRRSLGRSLVWTSSRWLMDRDHGNWEANNSNVIQHFNPI